MNKSIFISDEINEHIITVGLNDDWHDKQDGTGYPSVLLESGERFYFNRFIYL